VSSDRRLATIDDGHIISIGDVLGRRVVTAIDEHAVVLREPSGVQIRVGLGGRVLGIDR
jgi:exosome complex RNA-binding protein Rrp4